MQKFILTSIFISLLIAIYYDEMPLDTLVEKIKISDAEYPVGTQIKIARKEKKMSRKNLAIATGLTLENIEVIESGRAVPTRDIAFKIQNILDCEIVLDGMAFHTYK